MSTFSDVAGTEEEKGKGTTPKDYVSADMILGMQ